MKKILFPVCLLLSTGCLYAQTSDDAFKQPLKEVLNEIQQRYHVAIRYPEELVKDRWVTYAGWRFRPDVEKTMNNILSSQDISFAPDGDKKYKLQAYQYHLKTPAEGKEQLDYLSTLYNDAASWKKRREELKSCILSSLRLSHMAAAPASKPIVTGVRKFNGYTVQNIALETLPGVYVCGSLYRPERVQGKIPVVLNPDGHFARGRYRADCQYRCAALARMGAMAFSYDLFGWDGESQLQVKPQDHRRALVQSIHTLNAIRILDYLLSLKEADPARVAITGGSGGGSHTMLMTAIDDRITLSVPVVMVSSYHSGGCPCESGMGAQLCAGGSNNVEIAAMAAPRPQLVVSDGQDWTQHVPETEFPFLQKIYSYCGKPAGVENVHLAKEGHDYGLSKRKAMYEFVAKEFGLQLAKIKDASGNIDESAITVEKEPALYVFGDQGERLPANAVKGYDEVTRVFEAAAGKN
ncbi:MAG: acetylxylan esterase [Williamsia sp.]|nr:acetylxylan esterase [Williamsia sp.]